MCNLVVINEVEVEFEVVGDETYTTSLDIKSVFRKRHADILAQIRRLPQDDFNERNFSLVEYKDAKGEKRPMYHITKDGFVLLVMGFTGEKAYKFKVEYIKAFNAMAEEIKRLKFEKYVSEVANLNACLIDKAKRHRREINGYKSQLVQHNKQIAILQDKLAIFDDPKFQPFTKDHMSYGELFKEYISVLGNNNALKLLLRNQRKGNDKTKETILALDKIQKHLEPVYTALGAVMAYASDDDRFFMDRNEILK